jgi:hypothetical protein
MKRSIFLGFVVLAFAGLLLGRGSIPTSPSVSPNPGQGITPTCTTPRFPEPTALGIDTQCVNAGNGGNEAAQNTVKNNFCPTTNTGTVVTILEFQQLQNAVGSNHSINFGPTGPTTNRAPLTTLGEGRLVTLKAFVLTARQEGGESVNCKGHVPDQPVFHDIHISFVDAANRLQAGDTKPVSDKKECTGIVAEMSPHHRPANWTADNVNKVATAQALVRITGQQFFDSSHVPCSNGAPVGNNPKRISLWEIHPIYKFEVCTGDCAGAGQWVSLDEWLKTH